ncbi:MAG: hypothetical protein ACKVH7_16325 [Alphaproteobacteria bacterium]
MNKQKGTTVIDPATLTERTGSGYPAPFEEACMARSKVALGDAGGLTQYGVNLVTLQPGAWSAQRHWHSHAGETVLKPGMAGTAKAGVADGHHLINRSSTDAVYLEVGTREPSDACSYPDIDLHLEPDGESGHRFVTKSGEVY